MLSTLRDSDGNVAKKKSWSRSHSCAALRVFESLVSSNTFDELQVSSQATVTII